MREIVCAHCRLRVAVASPRAVYCSKLCRDRAQFERARAARRARYIRCECLNCGAEFRKPAHFRKKYCSVGCRRAAYRKAACPSTEKTCGLCGKKFNTRRSRQVYCSDRCRIDVEYNRRTRPPQNKKCELCGRPFSTRSLVKRFCSVKCSAASYRRRRHNIVEHEKVCASCGRTFRTFRRNSRLCSKECRRQVIYARHRWIPEKRTCQCCGSDFMARSRRHVYCSARCCETGLRLGLQGRRSVPPGGVSEYPKQVVCDICLKTFTAYRRHKHGFACSPACRIKEYRKHHSKPSRMAKGLCARCGNVIRDKGVKFCSERCSKLALHNIAVGAMYHSGLRTRRLLPLRKYKDVIDGEMIDWIMDFYSNGKGASPVKAEVLRQRLFDGLSFYDIGRNIGRTTERVRQLFYDSLAYAVPKAMGEARAS